MREADLRQPMPSSLTESSARSPEIVPEASGRVNLIGEHTADDFGMNLSISFDQQLLVELRDFRSGEIEILPLGSPDKVIVIADTGVKNDRADEELALRREKCQDAAQALGVDSLRDASWMLLEMNRERLSDEVFRRARHVITEIDRARNCFNRLRAGEWTAVASLLFASHESLRDDYEISCAELDELVKIARSPDFDGLVYGSRMTGCGFGGATVSLVDEQIVDRFCETLSLNCKTLQTLPIR
ncbi:MAG: galactokinase [Verrucomicrobiales bacterium]